MKSFPDGKLFLIYKHNGPSKGYPNESDCIYRIWITRCASTEEVAEPTPKDNELLLRICATTVTAVDSTFRKGDHVVEGFTQVSKAQKDQY